MCVHLASAWIWGAFTTTWVTSAAIHSHICHHTILLLHISLICFMDGIIQSFDHSEPFEMNTIALKKQKQAKWCNMKKAVGHNGWQLSISTISEHIILKSLVWHNVVAGLISTHLSLPGPPYVVVLDSPSLPLSALLPSALEPSSLSVSKLLSRWSSAPLVSSSSSFVSVCHRLPSARWFPLTFQASDGDVLCPRYNPRRAIENNSGDEISEWVGNEHPASLHRNREPTVAEKTT